MDWKSRIVELAIIRSALRGADTDQLWRYYAPSVAASAEQIAAAEAAMGEPLDPRYKRFLEHANGWRGFFQAVDLFGTDDLVGSVTFERANVELSQIDDAALSSSAIQAWQWFPIAASVNDKDLFVMARRSARTPGAVIWFAGSEVERFPDFDEFFLSMLDYNRLDLKLLEDAAQARLKRLD